MKKLIYLILVSMAIVCTAEINIKNPALNKVKFASPPKVNPVIIVKNGTTNAAIVISSKDKIAHKAAYELQNYVYRATGVKIKIIGASQASKFKTLIMVGESKLTSQYNIKVKNLPIEGFKITTIPAGIAIVGSGSGRIGTLFGVYDFLERFLGIRWYYPGPDGEIVPKRKKLIIPPVSYTDSPVFNKREYWPWNARGLKKGIDFNSFGRRWRKGASVQHHACHQLLYFRKHFKENSKCFELDKQGDRIETALCYSNPETFKIYMKDLEIALSGKWDTKKMGSTPAYFRKKIIPMMPYDREVNCYCTSCQKLVNFKAKDSAFGSASELIQRFYLKTAKAAKKKWPKATVIVSAYWNYTIPSPDIRYPNNTVALLSLMYGTASNVKPQIMEKQTEWLKGWRKATGQKVQLWSYSCWPLRSSLPLQYPHVIKKFYEKNSKSIAGAFVNGEPGGAQNLKGGEYSRIHLTLYCWFRLMWNPGFDVDAAMNEYITLMYGPAAAPVRKIFDILTLKPGKTKINGEIQIHCNSTALTPKQLHEDIVGRKAALRLEKLLVKAEKLAGSNNVYARRLEFLSQGIKPFLKESETYHTGKGIPNLYAQKISSAFKVNGKLDEKFWQKVKPYSFIMAYDRKNKIPIEKTTVKAVWNTKGLLLGFKMHESAMNKLKAEITGSDMPSIWMDDSLELFIDYLGSRIKFWHLIINSNNIIFDQYQNQRNLNLDGLKTAIFKGENYWSIELFIPFKAIGLVPKNGDFIYANFVRNRRTGKRAEYQRWNTTYRRIHADPMSFGKIIFINKKQVK